MSKESTILLYNSSTTGNAPSAGDLNLGELAVNTMDEKVFLKNLGGTVLSLSQTKDLSGNFARLDKVVYSLNGLTGTLSVTGTANEIEVSGSFPNIVVGLRDSVTINNLTVTQNITAQHFVGSLLGKVSVPCKNVESYTLTAGTPVYISGYVGAGASGVLEVKAALAASAAAMPAVGLVEQTLAPNNQGHVVELGLLGSLDTSAFVAGQVAFIAPSGGLTSTRPTSGSHLVQNIGRIVNASVNQGQIIVLGPGRSNDVPNNITVRGYLEMPNGQTATSLVTTFNGASGAILYSPSLATTSATGVASFNSTYFSVSSGAVSLASAYQATGDTVITVPGSGIAISTSGKTDTLFNIGVTSFNGSTGAVSYAPPLASASVTGVAHFPLSDFAVSATGSVTLSNVARTNAANTFTGLQRFPNGISAAGATFDAGTTVRVSSMNSHPEVNQGGGVYSGGSVSYEAVNNFVVVAGQGGNGEFPTKPYIAFQNNSVDTGADITFQTQGGDIKFTATTDIDIVASNGNVNISSGSGGIVIDPVTFVNIAGGLLYVDDTNNRVGINDTTPSMALCVNGGISGNSLIVAAGATFSSRANFAAGLTTANLFVSGGATFDSRANFPSGLTTANLFVSTGATFDSRANFAAGLTTANLFVSTGATFNSRANFAAGLTTANLFVSGGATFDSRANFPSGLTTANLFVSGGATFGAAVSITGALVATGATFTYNMSLGTDKNLLKDATFKDFGEVFGYQVRKEITDVKAVNRYYVDLTRGNIFYLDLQGSDNSGILGGFAVGSILPSIKVPSTAWATVTTTVGLTGATASTFNQGGTIAAGQFIFGPGITSTGCTAVSYNSGTGVIVLSKAAQATVSNAYTAFVQNNGEGFGMGPSPQTSVASTFPPARVHSFTLIVGATASASITWQTGATHYGQIKWPSGTAPTLTTTRGKFDVFSFLSYDYGTSWLAFNAGQNF